MGRFSITGRHAPVDMLRGPELEYHPKQRDTRFIDEINEKGCYIHVSSNADNKIAFELNKIVNETLPTPATLVGEGPVTLYDTAQWKNCSGFVFTPNAPSLLAHKHDFWSCRLKTNSNRNFAEVLKKKIFFVAPTKEDALKKYSAYLSTNFNEIDEKTLSTLGKSKKLFLDGDVSFSRAKYREMKLRCRFDSVSSSDIKDVSSKVLIATNTLRPHADLRLAPRRDVMKQLADLSEQDTNLGEVLEHAIIKLNKMSSKAYQRYMAIACDSVAKKYGEGRYTKYMAKYQRLPPNEHLLLPSFEEVKGIYINLRSVGGIDHAFELKKALEQRQAERKLRKYNAAILYRPSISQDNNYFRQAGWAQALLPWSSKGLIESAKTGMVTAEDGKTFQPQHRKLLKMVSTSDYLLGEPPKLGDVKQGKNNPLHLAIESGRDAEVIKFFYYWDVCPIEPGEKGKSAIELANDANHPAHEFLSEKSAERSETQLSEGRKAFFLQEEDSGAVG